MATIPDEEGACHLFRHTMATLMHEGGADIRYIQAMLGHADLKTTEIYTHVAIRQLQEIHLGGKNFASNWAELAAGAMPAAPAMDLVTAHPLQGGLGTRCFDLLTLGDGGSHG